MKRLALALLLSSLALTGAMADLSCTVPMSLAVALVRMAVG